MTTATLSPAGHLEVDFGPMRDGFQEPVCPTCSQPIRWILDMHSFINNPEGTGLVLVHAWCAWKPDGFDFAKKKAKDPELET